MVYNPTPNVLVPFIIYLGWAVGECFLSSPLSPFSFLLLIQNYCWHGCRIQCAKGFDEVPLQFAIHIWNQIELSMVFNATQTNKIVSCLSSLVNFSLVLWDYGALNFYFSFYFRKFLM